MANYSHKGKFWRNAASTPFIYIMIVPLLLLDICIEVYHRVCFALYGLPYVPRGRYFALDRELLPYLNPLQRAHCAFCTYANGLLLYASAIAGETERYWCPIKHKSRSCAAPKHHVRFAAYGNKRRFRELIR